MSTEYKEGDFHWVKFEGGWTIAKFLTNSKKYDEVDPGFSMWFRHGATYSNYQHNFQEIDPEPIKRNQP